MLTTLPADTYVREWRLAITVPDDDTVMSELTLKSPYGTPMAEMWGGAILLAAQDIADVEAVSAWLESLDGRVSPFKLLLPADAVTHENIWSASLASTPVLGSETIALAISPPTGTIKAGTLFSVGDIEDGPFQLFEVLEDTPAASIVMLPIAPRVRCRFLNSYDPVVFDIVYGRFNLSVDDVDAEMMIATGMATVQLIEAPYA